MEAALKSRSESSSCHPPLVDGINARRPLTVTAPAVEIELEGHVVELGKRRSAGLSALRPRRTRPAIVRNVLRTFYDELARIPVTAPYFFRKNWTAGRAPSNRPGSCIELYLIDREG